jgi:hypothetical protein
MAGCRSSRFQVLRHRSINVSKYSLTKDFFEYSFTLATKRAFPSATYQSLTGNSTEPAEQNEPPLFVRTTDPPRSEARSMWPVLHGPYSSVISLPPGFTWRIEDLHHDEYPGRRRCRSGVCFAHFRFFSGHTVCFSVIVLFFGVNQRDYKTHPFRVPSREHPNILGVPFSVFQSALESWRCI